jgi:phosphoserine aminotransferase
MLFMTAKLDRNKVLIALGALAIAILAIILLFGGGSSQTAAAVNLSSNDARVDYLKTLGWEVHAAPAESGQVRIPKQSSEVYDRYNDLQKAQGFDLSQFAGKTVDRYVYKVTNYPGATEPVYATLLIYKNKVIGGDIINTAPTGAIQGLQKAPAN